MKKFTNQQESHIADLYLKGFNTIELSNKFYVSDRTIRNILDRQNISRRSKGRRYIFNEHIFDIIDTEEKAYWLGFLWGDGNVRKDGTLTVELSQKDKGHLNKINKFFNHSQYIKNTRKKCCIVRFCSKYLIFQLQKYNIVPNKTYKNLQIQNVPKYLLRHFYRGLYDADGFSTYPHVIGFCGYNNIFLENIKNWINQNINYNGGHLRLHKNKFGQGYVLSYGGRQLFRKISHLLYDNNKINLDRQLIKNIDIYYN